MGSEITSNKQECPSSFHRIMRKKGKVAALREEVEANTGNGLSPAVRYKALDCNCNNDWYTTKFPTVRLIAGH